MQLSILKIILNSFLSEKILHNLTFIILLSVSHTLYAEDELLEENIVVKNPFVKTPQPIKENTIETNNKIRVNNPFSTTFSQTESPLLLVKNNIDVSMLVKKFLTKTIGQPIEKRLKIAEAAIEQANTVLNKAPKSVQHHLLKVAALGAAARATPFMDSVKARYGSRSKQAIEAMLKVASKEPWPQFFAGIWHLEVDRRGGIIGMLLLGGSVGKGHELVAEAMKKLPNEPTFQFAYAITLLSSNDDVENIQKSKQLLIQFDKLKYEEKNKDLIKIINQQSATISSYLSKSQLDKAKEIALTVM